MISPQAIEESVLSLLCYSQEQAHLLALKITDARLFTNDTNRKIAETALNYITQYSAPPRGQLELLLEQDMTRGQDGNLLTQEIARIKELSTQIDPRFVIEELDNFLERQKLTKSFENALELLQQGEIQKAKEAAYKVALTPPATGDGIWLNDPVQALSFLNATEEGDYFSSGIETLDRRRIRPERKTLMFLMAAAGKGKSWWLVEVGKAAILHHHKVLHITLELSQEKTTARYIQALFSLTRHEQQQLRVPYFLRDTSGACSIEFNEFIREPILSKKAHIIQTLGWLPHKQFIIKEFPTGSLSTEHLCLYMDSLEQREGFRPDILIIDYADLMNIDTAQLRIDTGRLYKELRGIAVSRDMAIVTASQGNRDSDTAKTVGRTNVAEDWSKIGTADTILTYSQTAMEHHLNMARILAAKGRDAEDQFVSLIAQAYPIGQFCLDSMIMSAELVTQLEALQSQS